MILILQQGDTLAGYETCHILVAVAAYLVLGLLRIDVWILKKAHLELHAKDIRHGTVDLFLLDEAVLHGIHQRFKGQGTQVGIHTGTEGHDACLLLVACHAMSAMDAVDAIEVTHHESSESPFAT